VTEDDDTCASVSRIKGPDGENVVCIGCNDPSCIQTTDADADLIAAAPDLLAAAKTVARELVLWARSDDLVLSEILDAAIKKATGE